MGKHHDTAVARVAEAIEDGHILKSYSPLYGNETTTVGPYNEAVDRGMRYACIGWLKPHYSQSKGLESRFKTAEEAADCFVSRVGSTRANDAVKEASRKAAQEWESPAEGYRKMIRKYKKTLK